MLSSITNLGKAIWNKAQPIEIVVMITPGMLVRLFLSFIVSRLHAKSQRETLVIVHTKGKHHREIKDERGKMRREESNSRRTRKYDFNRACPEVAEGNSRDTAGQGSVRLRKKGKVGKRGRKPKELLVFPSSLFFIFPSETSGQVLCYTRV
jgi:hypothetical protein